MKEFKDKLVGYMGKEPIIGTLQVDSCDTYRLTLTCCDKQIIRYIPMFTPTLMARGMLKSYAQDLVLSCLNLDVDVIKEDDNE